MERRGTTLKKRIAAILSFPGVQAEEREELSEESEEMVSTGSEKCCKWKDSTLGSSSERGEEKGGFGDSSSERFRGSVRKHRKEKPFFRGRKEG